MKPDAVNNPALEPDHLMLAAHRGNVELLRGALVDPQPHIRALAISGLSKLGALSDSEATAAAQDPDRLVRHRVAQLGSTDQRIDLLTLLGDPDFAVAETAAWALGERHESRDADQPDGSILDALVLAALIESAETHPHQLVRESCIAALGAIGDPRGLPTILAGCDDKPAVRRRAVLALAPFEGKEVDRALANALSDRDWQVRQAAEDLLGMGQTNTSSVATDFTTDVAKT